MNGPSELRKTFDDPLYASLKKNKKHRESPNKEAAQDIDEAANHSSSGGWIQVVVVILAAALIGLGIYLYQANQQLERLSLDLTESQGQLQAVSTELLSSKEQIGSLQEGLGKSQSEITTQQREISRYKSLYQNVKSEQEQHGRDLQAITIQKADQSQVEALRGETSTIREQVSAVQGNVSDLREMTTRNRTDIQSQGEAIQAVTGKADATSQDLAAFKQTFDREQYNFELHEKGAIMKVFDVALSLKDIDFSRQRYDLDIITGAKRIRKDNHPINEPIYFYVEGISKPYELVVERIDKKFVVGHLSVPKKAPTSP